MADRCCESRRIVRCNDDAGDIMLDNVAHIQSSWFGEGKKAGQVGLHFGADDFGAEDFFAAVPPDPADRCL